MIKSYYLGNRPKHNSMLKQNKTDTEIAKCQYLSGRFPTKKIAITLFYL